MSSYTSYEMWSVFVSIVSNWSVSINWPYFEQSEKCRWLLYVGSKWNCNISFLYQTLTWGDRWPINRCFLDFTMAIDCDRGHCYEHFKRKKIKLRWKLSPWHIFECLCMRWSLSCQKWQKGEVWDFSGSTCLS